MFSDRIHHPFNRAALLCLVLAAGSYAQSAPTILTTSLPAGSVGAQYSVALNATGGTPPYKWFYSGSLPPGLTILSTGTISGVPTTAGSYSLTLVVSDSRNAAASQTLTITIIGPTLTIGTNSTLLAATIGAGYSQQFQVTGGTAPYQWTTSSSMPPGLSLSSGGLLSGTPTSAGSFSLQIKVTDSTGLSTTGTFTLSVIAPPLTITTVQPLFSGTVGLAYSETFSASGGTPPYTWSVISGQTGGLTLDPSGTLHGVPQSAGTLSFAVQVTDKAGATASQSFSVTVNAPSPVITATASTLASGIVGSPYNQNVPVTATSGTPPYTWSMSGSVPGLTFNAVGPTLSGTPTSAGTFTLTFRVADSAGLSASIALPITIAPASLTITTARTLAGATLNAPYSQTITAAGGSPPYNWSAAGLPAGLSIDSNTGLISGTPSAAGSFNPVVITVTDAAVNHYSDNFSLAVALPPLPSVTVSGLPSSVAPAQQYPLSITLSSAYPAPITGQVILSFTPDTGPGDNTVLFAAGGTTTSFSVPTGSVTAQTSVPLAVQSGTAAGTVSISLRFQAGGVDITPSPAPSISGHIDRAAPVIVSTQVTRTSNSISISITGYSTAREVTHATFTFNAASGQTLQSSAGSMLVDTTALFSGFFGSSQQGSQFIYTQPFTVTGDPTAVLPASVTLVNSQGSVNANINP